MQVSIWGLLDDNNENPFDLIETHHGTGRIDDSDDSVTLVDVMELESIVPENGFAPSDALHLRLFVCMTVACLAMYWIS
jgi:hypothetical protein